MTSFILALLIPAQAVADDTPNHGPYCGIYAVYSVAQHFTKPVDFDSLSTPRFVSSFNGSSIENMLDALNSVGVHGHALADLRLSQITSYRHPTILHVRALGSQVVYRHWVLFLGPAEEGGYRIYDPPRGRLTLSAAELLAIWDGKGIAVTLPDEPLPREWFPLPWLVAVGLMTIALALLSRLSRWVQRLAVPVAAVLAMLVWQFADGTSFQANPYAVGMVSVAHFEETVPEIDYDTLKAKSGATLIDARLADAYQRGHLPGAISLPVVIGYGQLKTAMATIPRDATVIFYCQSEQCAWADSVANQFHHQGYRNISIYRGGYSEWQKRAAGAGP